MNFLVRLLLYSLAVLIAANILNGVSVENYLYALIVAGVLAILNSTIKPLLVILTIPLTVLTLGLFLVVINTLIILLASWLVPGFHVASFWWAMGFGIVLWFINAIFMALSGQKA
ncbi:MAG: phage holin family protein [Cyclobacteriaceae bacterium]|nr:phage holin family protein [Cyclobacteriaceae bacterium]